MTDTSLPQRLERPTALSFLIYAAVIIVMLWSFQGAGFSVDKILSSPPRFADFVSRAFPPNVEPKVLLRLFWKMVETLQIAFAGAIIGIVLSVPIALFAARGLIAGQVVNTSVRNILGFIRSVPDLAWALVFVVAVGLGPFAGTLAIAIDTIGFCGRFFADDMEAIDKGPSEALTATGATRIDIAACATVPASMPAFVSTALYALEKAVRSSTVLGLVGAGGIGIELKVGFDLFDYPTAMTVIVMIAVVVLGIEAFSTWARKKIIGEQR
ncbi:phosphonate ABC transporter, permease protein PhnE [Pacificibacter marinus]|uniref:phosphonate ABC transporter, permease protein PhnE n=1 Tax=Pacificibacter marinus TaxID=658057 RepID=UPI001C065DAA|nr:phosphonate ABC transporter, permease protein PhnE [Pacificibacter marinus]MBU2867379.1 phosphonate ABC transporter, permease protein PhnE [Pacificibacter marinus]